MTGIYKIQSPDGLVYIGKSRQVETRIKRHILGWSLPVKRLQQSFDLHGVNNHVFSVAHELPPDVTDEVIDNYEYLYVMAYKEAGISLNLRDGGKNGKHSPETCLLIGRIKIGNKNRLGIKQSKEAKEKISKSKTGRTISWNTGLKMSAESREKMSKAKKGKPTWNRGSNGKINEKDVLDIRLAFSNGTMQKELAKKYNVSSGIISKICTNKTWKNI